VTGIPNFDNLSENLQNNLPQRGYVLVATSPLRESFRRDDRAAFLRKCAEIAAGRPLIFKLHPTEHSRRARAEIARHAPGALVFEHGNVNHMIANADVVITQQSTCTFVAIALGKEVHTNLDLAQLNELMPIQNGRASAERIANVCHRLLLTPVPILHKVRRGRLARPRWEQADTF